MKYDVKLKICGIDVLQNENADPDTTTPYITNVKLKSSTSLKGLDIGSTASDSIFFTMHNPFKQSFDGDKVELYLMQADDVDEPKNIELEDEVGDDSTDQTISSYESEVESNYVEQDDEEEEITDESAAAQIEQETRSVVASVLDDIDGELIGTEQVTTDEAEETWEKFGTYYVYSATSTEDGSIIEFEAHDGFSKLSGKYEPSDTVCTLQEAYDAYKTEVYTKFGIVVDSMDFASDYDDKQLTFDYRYTYRSFIGLLAGAVGGFATFGLDDTLGISFYNFTDKILLSDELVSYSDTSNGSITIDSISCDRAKSIFKTDIISSDDDPSSDVDIVFNNHIVDQDMLDVIYADLHGITYNGANVTALWSPALESGSFLRIMDDDEYKNYIQLRNELSTNTTLTDSEKLDLKVKIIECGKTILITNQTITFAGDCKTVIDSVLPSVYKKEAQITSPSDAKFDHLYAEMIEADYIDAVKVVTDGLIAKNADIQDLVVESINGHSIKNTYILAKALSDEALLTAYGINVYYSAIDPTESHDDVKNGDLWWVTVQADSVDENTVLKEYRDGEWTSTPLDAKTFRANSITAQEIASNTITSSNIAAGAITADKIDVTDLSAIGATIGGWTINDDSISNTGTDTRITSGSDSDSNTETKTYDNAVTLDEKGITIVSENTTDGVKETFTSYFEPRDIALVYESSDNSHNLFTDVQPGWIGVSNGSKISEISPTTIISGGNIYTNGRSGLECIGQYDSTNTLSRTTTTAGIDNTNCSASLSLTPGSYMIMAEGGFTPTSTLSGMVQVIVRNGGATGAVYAQERVFSYVNGTTKFYTKPSCTGYITTTTNTTLYMYLSSHYTCNVTGLLRVARIR